MDASKLKAAPVDLSALDALASDMEALRRFLALHGSERACAAFARIASALEAARADGEWLPIESAPEEWRDGRRLLLGWKYDNPALAPHFELGWFSGAAWRNTYGHPFSGDPDFLLRPRPLPSPPAEEKKT